MSLDDPSLDPLKWGTSALGTDSGQIGWSMDLTGLDTTAAYSIEDFQIEVMQAFARWEDVADVDFVMVDPGDALVTFAMGTLDSGAGLARIRYTESGDVDRIISGAITMDTDRTWTPEGQPGGSDFYAVALHEVGHILGLGHIIDDTEIMNPIVRVDDLGDRDIAAIRALYGEADGGGDDGPFVPPDVPPDDEIEVVDSDDPAAPSDGGGGGGAGIAILGLLAAVFGMLFGGGSGAAVLAVAGDVDDDIPEPEDDGLPPQIFVHEHEVYLPEDGVAFHGHGCTCGCCDESFESYV